MSEYWPSAAEQAAMPLREIEALWNARMADATLLHKHAAYRDAVAMSDAAGAHGAVVIGGKEYMSAAEYAASIEDMRACVADMDALLAARGLTPLPREEVAC